MQDLEKSLLSITSTANNQQVKHYIYVNDLYFICKFLSLTHLQRMGSLIRDTWKNKPCRARVTLDGSLHSKYVASRSRCTGILSASPACQFCSHPETIIFNIYWRKWIQEAIAVDFLEYFKKYSIFV